MHAMPFPWELSFCHTLVDSLVRNNRFFTSFSNSVLGKRSDCNFEVRCGGTSIRAGDGIGALSSETAGNYSKPARCAVSQLQEGKGTGRGLDWRPFAELLAEVPAIVRAAPGKTYRHDRGCAPIFVAHRFPVLGWWVGLCDGGCGADGRGSDRHLVGNEADVRRGARMPFHAVGKRVEFIPLTNVERSLPARVLV